MIYDFSLVPGAHFWKETSHGPTHHYIIEIASLCAFDLSLCWYRYSVLWSKTTLILVHEVHSSHELKDNICLTVPSFCFIINFLLSSWNMSKSIKLFCNLLNLPKINNSLTSHGPLAATLSWSPLRQNFSSVFHTFAFNFCLPFALEFIPSRLWSPILYWNALVWVKLPIPFINSLNLLALYIIYYFISFLSNNAFSY